ncbi:MAG TPA: TetR/AcrR family transcriptional regulator [Clostridiales bacterium]|nr:TetR/AcrR family transcriptional regulator [Clostridiales bacterium]
MRRDEKNLLSRRKILDSAFEEFGNQGYGLSSVNTICTAGDISKGILYHYFKDKDELYLVCIREMFDSLTEHLQNELSNVSGTKEARLERYFDARLRFFRENPLHHNLFCDVIVAPPAHLAQAISEIKADFDTLNISVLTELLQSARLRSDITIQSAVETFRLYQDFVNARYQMEPAGALDLEKHEKICKRSLSILLYGVIERDGNEI